MLNAYFLFDAAAHPQNIHVATAFVTICWVYFTIITNYNIITINGVLLLAALHTACVIAVAFHGGRREATVRGLEHPDRATTRHQEQQSTSELKNEPRRRTATRGHRPGVRTEWNRRGFLIRSPSIGDGLVFAGLL